MVTLVGAAIDVWRVLCRGVARPVQQREPAAIDANPQIQRTIKLTSLANDLAEQLAQYPASWHEEVVAHVCRVLGVEPRT